VAGLAAVDEAAAARLLDAGWQPEPAGAPGAVDGLISAGVPDAAAVARLAEDGLFLVSLGGDFAAAAAQREELQALWGCTVHLFDPAPHPGPMLAFGWQGRRMARTRIRALMVLPHPAETHWGGMTVSACESTMALAAYGTRVDLAGSLRLVMTGSDLVHLHGLRFADQAAILQACPVPIVASPMVWDRTESIVGAQMATAILAEGGDTDSLFAAWRKGQMDLDSAAERASRTVAADVATQRPALAVCRRLLVSGPGEADMAARVFGKLPCEVVVVPCGLRPQPWIEAGAEPFRARYGLDEVVLCVGSLEPRHNQAMLIRALQDVPVDLVFIGAEPVPEYGALCRSLAGERVHFLGPVSPGMLASAYAAALVHASPAWLALPGVANLEAAMAGCALVVGNPGEATAYFGTLAQACDPADWRSIRMAVLRALHGATPRLRRQISRYVSGRYDAKQTIQVLQYAYDTVLAEARRR
jgi:glycosyltransferase involved in cell wall biosynthesis